jgi:hypothetical protein
MTTDKLISSDTAADIRLGDFELIQFIYARISLSIGSN